MGRQGMRTARCEWGGGGGGATFGARDKGVYPREAVDEDVEVCGGVGHGQEQRLRRCLGVEGHSMKSLSQL